MKGRKMGCPCALADIQLECPCLRHRTARGVTPGYAARS